MTRETKLHKSHPHFNNGASFSVKRAASAFRRGWGRQLLLSVASAAQVNYAGPRNRSSFIKRSRRRRHLLTWINYQSMRDDSTTTYSMRFTMNRIGNCVFLAGALLVACGATAAEPAAPGYHVIKTISPGGEGGWDWLTCELREKLAGCISPDPLA